MLWRTSVPEGGENVFIFPALYCQGTSWKDQYIRRGGAEQEAQGTFQNWSYDSCYPDASRFSRVFKLYSTSGAIMNENKTDLGTTQESQDGS